MRVVVDREGPAEDAVAAGSVEEDVVYVSVVVWVVANFAVADPQLEVIRQSALPIKQHDLGRYTLFLRLGMNRVYALVRLRCNHGT